MLTSLLTLTRRNGAELDLIIRVGLKGKRECSITTVPLTNQRCSCVRVYPRLSTPIVNIMQVSISYILNVCNTAGELSPPS